MLHWIHGDCKEAVSFDRVSREAAFIVINRLLVGKSLAVPALPVKTTWREKWQKLARRCSLPRRPLPPERRAARFPMNCGSKLLKGNMPQYDAEIVSRLKKVGSVIMDSRDVAQSYMLLTGGRP